MAREFQDIQQLDPEENDHQLGRGKPPPQPSLLQRLCSMFRLSLLVLGLNILLLVAVCVMGSHRAQLQVELQTLKETFSNFSSSTQMEILALSSHGGGARDKVTSLEAKLEKQQQDLKADHDTLLFHLKHFPVDIRTLTCRMAFLHSNGTECCPVNWVDYEGSCYWFSRSGKPWPEAEKYCQLEGAHLVVINSREEQKFVAHHANSFQTWIGLTDSDGSWKWVDGTDYSHSYNSSTGHFEKRKDKRVLLLPSPSLLCSPHDRPMNWRRSVEARNRTLFGKLADQEDGRLMSVKKPSCLS
ncbi:asialoglycoprotein receptor 2 isoform X1 [Hippopotamus amphibius kiboko]|uniref:asialoglycoprotein receptor 2 isoform X1 n=1 Tax=Hippopotamus amphibius kiboko TaxID=575201 RepID=UPI002594F6FA|nr:asialoglycoprotein receptor 2 isoform X1 [Hippopotamus amphibius kiboko]XP_057571551.1 asialoglycoprotein receptor 2 isoform X1 [Hippopotamus amphibius kiboko]